MHGLNKNVEHAKTKGQDVRSKMLVLLSYNIYRHLSFLPNTLTAFHPNTIMSKTPLEVKARSNQNPWSLYVTTMNMLQ